MKIPIDVEMKLRFWNANYVGTHFGGSLFAMTDAFYMLMLMHHLGRDYVVWDKAATIRYKEAGPRTRPRGIPFDRRNRSTMSAHKVKTLEKYEPVFVVEVKDESGVVIAEVEKLLHVRSVLKSETSCGSGGERSPRSFAEPRIDSSRGRTSRH